MTIQKFGVFGYPIGHSLSPAMHTAAFAALLMNDCEYKAYAVPSENLKDAVLKAKADGFKGLNLTIPHKEKILLSGIVEPDEFSKKAGAVNTLLFSDGGIKGYNTDALGALAALEHAGADVDGKNILIIGAGGAARSISFLFGERQNPLKIINRTAEKAEKLAIEIREKTGNQNVSGTGFSTAWDDLKKADIIIQTTDLGMGKYESVSFFDQLSLKTDDGKEKQKKEMISNHLKPTAFVFDIVYNPQETKFLKEAREAGVQTMNGMMMLVFQGALAFEIWTGKKPDIDVMANAVLKKLKNAKKDEAEKTDKAEIAGKTDEMEKLIGLIEKTAVSKHATVAMGIRSPDAETIRCAKAAVEKGYADVILVGDKTGIENAARLIFTDLPAEYPFQIIDTDEPEDKLVELLVSEKVDAVIRGTAKASDSLSNLKKACHIDKIHRIAILLTKDGNPYFFAPVGIDEGTTAKDKIEFICLGAHLLKRLGVSPFVGLISSSDDAGKKEAAEIVKIVTEEKKIHIVDYQMNLEEAFEHSNFIIAPNGITGNLIFRTLTFLAGGDGLGAPILTASHVFVDTSRSAGHYTKAIMVASALSKKNK